MAGSERSPLLASWNVERGSRVRTKVVPNVRRFALQTEIKRHVRQDGSATVYTDAP